MKNKFINIVVIIVISLFTLTIGVNAATTILASQVTHGDTTVHDILDELWNKAKPCQDGALCSKVQLGDYVSMTPTATTYTIPKALTGYDSDQTIDPSELNLWRVIAINSDGTIDMVSEYVSKTKVYLYGQVGYLNLVGTLNTIANQYGNSLYTVRTRYMGYNGQTSTIAPSTFTYQWDTYDNRYETIGGGDIMYKRDTDLVKLVLGTLKAYKNGTTIATTYWLASRYYYYYNEIGDSIYEEYYSDGRRVSTSGSIGSDSIYYYADQSWTKKSVGFAIRPIVTLRTNVTTSSGSGTSSSPWILS